MMWNEKQANALSLLFNELDNANVKWMVFRNFEGLPHNNPSKDVDLLVERKQINNARMVLEKAMKHCGYTRKTFEEFQCIWCYSFFKEELGHTDSIKIDLFYGQVWRGVPTVTFDRIYDSAVLYNGFYVPNPVMNSFLLWIKPVMTGGKVKEKYIPTILENADREEFQNLIKDVFGEKFRKRCEGFFSENKIRDTGRLQQEMCRISWLSGFKRHPFDSIVSTYMHFWLEIKRRSKRPNSTIICVLGPDGVGKTTVINSLQEKARDVFIRDEEKVVVWHFRPNVLPNLNKVFHPNREEAEEVFEQPHRAKPAGRIGSVIRMVYYWLDYLVGWKITKRCCVHGSIVIYDRYIYDFIVDPHRMRINLPDCIRKFFASVVPQPDKVFILTAPEKVIYARKKELEEEEIKRQLQEYKKLSETHDRFVVIDAQKSPEMITDEIIESWVTTLEEI